MKIKVVVLGLLLVGGVLLLWSRVIQPSILTNLHNDEMRAALVRFWNVVLDKSIIDEPSKLASVATGDELQYQISRIPFFADIKYREYLKSAEVVRVMEYTSTCSLIEAAVEHVSGHFRYFHLFVKEDDVWKVAHTDWILPQPDFAPPDEPTKNCSDFAQ